MRLSAGLVVLLLVGCGTAGGPFTFDRCNELTRLPSVKLYERQGSTEFAAVIARRLPGSSQQFQGAVTVTGANDPSDEWIVESAWLQPLLAPNDPVLRSRVIANSANGSVELAFANADAEYPETVSAELTLDFRGQPTSISTFTMQLPRGPTRWCGSGLDAGTSGADGGR